MKLDFNKIEEVSHMEFKGGKKCLMTRMYTDGMTKIMKDRLEPGASIGMHTHETDCEIIYILSGNGTVLYDDGEESLEPGDCHYCPKGHAHSLMNTGTEELVFFAVVPQQ